MICSDTNNQAKYENSPTAKSRAREKDRTPHPMSIPSYDFLDSDFHDLVNDLTCIYPPSVQNTLYTQILLHRWHSRILRLYSVADSFAAASVGARRSQNNIISNTLSQIEFSFALVLAKVSLNSNMNIWKSIKNNQGLNVPLDSINSRNATAIRFAQDYIERANVWSPEHAARASEQAKKMKKRKTKGISLFKADGIS